MRRTPISDFLVATCFPEVLPNLGFDILCWNTPKARQGFKYDPRVRGFRRPPSELHVRAVGFHENSVFWQPGNDFPAALGADH